MMPCRRLSSTVRAASSITSRSPDALVRDMRTPESKVALACLARTQFSIRALATFSYSARRLASSASAACLFLASNSLSTPPTGRLALRDGAAATAFAESSSAVTTVAGALAAELGRLRMLFSATSGGGARSLKTLRPSLSNHCHCATAAPPIPTRAKARRTECIFMRAV